MSDTTTTPAEHQVTGFAQRPKRADARRNYEKLLAAAGDAFGDLGTAASLEDIARRAGVGIGTLYRHFPTRQALLEAVYIDEVEEMSAKADDLGDLGPWDALSTWLHQFVRFAATKRALADEMLNTMDAEAPVFVACRTAITEAGDMLLQRAQASGEARPDTTFTDVGRMVSGIASIRTADPGQIERILDMALDGLRYTGE
ncbi:MAG TPA: TetR/AcrR family transcriptional regulator [Baekduia sp.]|nr:TetR/AcrR family transcriptional regulator [Baekduia sp.]